MSSDAARSIPVGADLEWRTPARAARFLARDSLLIVCVCGFAIALAFGLAIQVNPDAWLAFLNGRWIVHHGLPHRDVFTIWGAGPWADQQWLSQVGLYGLYASGGIALAAFAHALLTLTALVSAIVVARRRGAASRSVLYVFPFAVWPLITSQWQVRTQSFAYPLFVLLIWLLVEDSRRPSRRVFWTLPLLALWANVHGSVALAAGLVCLRAITRLTSAQTRLGGVVLFVIAPAMLFMSPYGLALGGYYHRTLFNPAFGAMLNEWQPPHFTLVTAPFFALALAVAWLIGRSGRSLTLFEKVALLATLAAALTAMRNLGWFATTALILAPAALTDAYPQLRRQKRSSTLDVALPSFCAAAAIAVLLLTLARPTSWFTRGYPAQTSDAVARVADQHPAARIFADVKYGDWLIFDHPELAGRIAYDARFELLPPERIKQIYYFGNPYSDAWRSATRGFEIVVLDRRVEGRVVPKLRAAGARLVSDRRGAVVLAFR